MQIACRFVLKYSSKLKYVISNKLNCPSNIDIDKHLLNTIKNLLWKILYKGILIKPRFASCNLELELRSWTKPEDWYR